MASIYIRDVDEALVYRLKRNALDAGISLKEYCLQLLSAADPVASTRKKTTVSSPERPKHAPTCRCILCTK